MGLTRTIRCGSCAQATNCTRPANTVRPRGALGERPASCSEMPARELQHAAAALVHWAHAAATTFSDVSRSRRDRLDDGKDVHALGVRRISFRPWLHHRRRLVSGAHDGRPFRKSPTSKMPIGTLRITFGEPSCSPGKKALINGRQRRQHGDSPRLAKTSISSESGDVRATTRDEAAQVARRLPEAQNRCQMTPTTYTSHMERLGVAW